MQSVASEFVRGQESQQGNGWGFDPAETSSSPIEQELAVLRHQLEAVLSDRQIPMGIRCTVLDGRLIVVAHHRPEVALEPMEVLRSLRSLIQSCQMAFARRVRLYLRVMGGAVPYARCYFTLAFRDQAVLAGAIDPSAHEQAVHEQTAHEQAVHDQATQQPPSIVEPPLVVEAASVAEEASVGEDGGEPLQWVAWLESDTTTLARWNDFGARYQGHLVHPALQLEAWLSLRKRRWPWDNGLEHYGTITSGMAVLGLALSGYLVSSPCVSGACPELETAQALGQQSVSLMAEAQDTTDLRAAQDYLDGAMEALDRIPTWSERSAEAVQLAERYQEQVAVLGQAIAAADLADAAERQSRSPVGAVETWGTIQLLWQQALDQLQGIPMDSPLYGFAQRQIDAYQTRFAFAKAQREQEADGQQQLQMAKQEIRMAQLQHGKATNELEWELTRVAWHTAIERLRGIAPDTQAGVEAQRLLLAYGEIPGELGDRLSVGLLATPSVPPLGDTAGGDRVYQTPANWADLSQTIPVPPPPVVIPSEEPSF